MIFLKQSLLLSFFLMNFNLSPVLAQHRYNYPVLNNYFVNLGLNNASKICQRYTRSNLRQECNDIIKKAYYFDSYAVSLCEYKFWISTMTINCLEYIVNKNYSHTELAKCGNSNDERTIYNCLNSSGKRVNKNQLIDDYESQSAFNNVENICKRFTSSSIRNDCNKLLKENIFFDINAVNICQTKFRISTKIVGCFQIINNKNYSFAEISECHKQSKEADILNCLSTKGNSITLTN